MRHYHKPEKCKSTHVIYYDELYEAVLLKIRSTAQQLRDDTAFHDMVNKRLKQDSTSKQLAEKKAKLEKRQSELARLLRKLFEDNAAGLVNDANYSVMFKSYQDEQAETAEKLQVIYAEASQKDTYLDNAEKLRGSIREYLEIKELTPFILNKLIERIEVGQLEIRNEQKHQEITIFWRFCREI